MNAVIELLTYVSFLFFSLGQLGRVSLFGQQVNIYLFEIILFVNLLVLIVVYRVRVIKQFYRKMSIAYFFFLWLLVSYLTGIGRFQLKENVIGAFYGARLMGYFLYFLYLFHHLKAHKRLITRFFAAIVAYAIVTLLIAIVQYIWYPDLRNLIYMGWDPHLYRIFGLFFDSSIAAAVYGMLFFFLLLNQKRFFSIFLLASMIFTYSRSAYLSFVPAMVYSLFKKRNAAVLGICLLLFFLLLILLLPKPAGEGVNLRRIYSIGSRLDDYKQAIAIWKKNPIFGVGYNRIRYVKNGDASHAGASFHSSYLIILVSGGVVGLALFLTAFYRLWMSRTSLRIYMLFLGLMSLGDNILLHSFILFLGIHIILVSFLSDRSR